jgi:hypothetical protein
MLAPFACGWAILSIKEKTVSETPNRSSTRTVLIIVGALLLLLLCACLAVLGANWAFKSRSPMSSIIEFSRDIRIGGQAAERFEHEAVFEVGSPVVLELTNDVGDVRIIGVEGNEVRVEAVIRGYGSTQEQARKAMESVKVSVDQVADNHIRAVGEIPAGPYSGQSPSVVWTVRVPYQAQLIVTNGVGDVRIEKITGSMQVNSDIGDVIAKRFTLTDDSYVLTDLGTVSISLPRDSEFALEADAHLGKIKSEFHAAAEPGDTLTATVGDEPLGTLTVRTDIGNIDIGRE